MASGIKRKKQVIEAAGGILWRLMNGSWYVAIIHRQRYDDWSLPKGKRKSDESWLETAVREVMEETNCRLEVVTFAGTVSYLVDGAPKVVLFWHMLLDEQDAFRDHNETDSLSWLSPAEALKKMTYEKERNLLNAELERWRKRTWQDESS